MLFVMLIFAFMGVAAVSIDLAFASMTQAEMQNAADTAAIEGARLRDFGPYRAFGDKNRRPRVSELVQMVFDDDLHPTHGVAPTAVPPAHGGLAGMDPDDPDSLRLGVGPVWSLSGGVGGADAGALLIPDGQHVAASYCDDPVLQFNTDNLKNGDMLAGLYDPFSSHFEHADYERPDFLPAQSEDESSRSIGFLVRMRRTHGGDSDEQQGISSGGPALPFVFGLGSSIHRDHTSGPDGYNPRTEGVTVRAVAVAAARPAMGIGAPPNANDRIGNPMLGLGYWYLPAGATLEKVTPPVALTLEFWRDTLALHATTTLTRAGSDLLDSNGVKVGTFLGLGAGRSIGERIISFPPPSDIPQNFNHYNCYFPIYAPILDAADLGTDRIVGYGYGVVQQPTDTIWSVSKGFTGYDDTTQTSGSCAVFVAPDNATAHLSPHAPQLSKTEWQHVFEAYNSLGYLTGSISFKWQDIRPGTVMAPVLAR